MIKVKRYIALLLLLICALLCACSPKGKNYLAPFDGAFETNIEGEYHGVSFCATLSCEAETGGVRAATLTFYAPASMKGTVLSRDAEGLLTLSVGDVTLAAPAQYAALLDVFSLPRAETALREGAQTRVSGDGYSLLFAEDGTPLSLVKGEISARVLAFSKK